MNNKQVILTGLRSNNDLHIGNYFGAIMPMVDMARTKADTYQINLFVPDLHSFTTPIDHSQLQAQIMNNLRLFVAAGLPLDHPDVHMYRQSYIPAHSELTWILDCFTGFGEMRRMTQFKEKSGLSKVRAAINKEDEILQVPDEHWNEETLNQLHHGLRDAIETSSENVSVGLFNYPVLMAADILLYGASYVPVGDDQTQHLEFTRDIAERMNNRFGELFTVPEPVKKQHDFFSKDQGLRIRDLASPAKKMSKSDESGKGIIFLGDNPTDAAKKIMSAETDSVGQINFDWQTQPGITNLLQMLAMFSGTPQSGVNDQWCGEQQYGPLKKAVADATSAFLTDFQAKLSQVDESQILSKLESSEATMRDIAAQTLLRVQQAVGLRPQ